ncbi:MAG: AzlD domain-containing protein [Trueperaceae bacterium]
MSGPQLWLTIAAMALLSYALRVSFLLLHERLGFPPVVRRALRYVPYAVLAALLLPAVFAGGEEAFAIELPRIGAALLGALIALRTGSVILTLSLGMLTLWVGQWFL